MNIWYGLMGDVPTFIIYHLKDKCSTANLIFYRHNKVGRNIPALTQPWSPDTRDWLSWHQWSSTNIYIYIYIYTHRKPSINAANGSCMFGALVKFKQRGLITMNPGKWEVNLNRIFMLYKSTEICLPISLPSMATSMLIFLTWRQVFTCRYDLYNHRYNLYIPGCNVFTCKNVLYTSWYDFYTHGSDVFTFKNVLYNHWCNFYTHGCDVFTCKNILYTHWYNFIPITMLYLTCMGNFYMSSHNFDTPFYVPTETLIFTNRTNFYTVGTIFYNSNQCLASH